MDISKAVSLTPSQDGFYVTQDQVRIARIIKDYDPELELIYIDPGKRVSPNLAFAVTHEPVGKPPYIVFYAERCDERILERVFTHDNTRTNVLHDVEIKEAVYKAMKAQEWAEQNEEGADIGAHAMASPLNWYKFKRPHDGKLITVRN
jgi:hypothetical protein